MTSYDTCTYDGTTYALLEEAILNGAGDGFTARVWPLADVERADVDDAPVAVWTTCDWSKACGGPAFDPVMGLAAEKDMSEVCDWEHPDGIEF